MKKKYFRFKTNISTLIKARSHTNRISAETFSRIGQTTNEEMYVMGSSQNEADRAGRDGREKNKSAELGTGFPFY